MGTTFSDLRALTKNVQNGIVEKTEGRLRHMKNITLDFALSNYIDTLAGSNLSVNTASAYLTDIKQFIAYLSATDTTAIYPQNVTRRHVTEYLSYLADLGRTGVTRGRKLAAIR